MTTDLVWATRLKWHRFESPRSYASRQCEAAGVPIYFVEQTLTTPTRTSLSRVWGDDIAAGRVVEAAAGRPPGHFVRMKERAQPDPEGRYPKRFLCRLCAAAERVEQIPHDRENWCLRHPGQMVWTGPGTTPETQLIAPFGREQASAERRFRRMAAAHRLNAALHARVWEMVRDNASLSKRRDESAAVAPKLDDREIAGRAALYPMIVAVMEVLSDDATVLQWQKLPTASLRAGIIAALPQTYGPVEVLVERIVLWLRPVRRVTRRTRMASLCPALDVVDAAAIIDITAPYPLWIQRNPGAIVEWAWWLNEAASDPWDASGISKKAWWACDEGHRWEASPSTRGLAATRCPYCVGQRVWPGHSDLRTTHPRLAAEWDKTRGLNAGDPNHVSASSRRRVHWRCRRGHRWTAPIQARVTMGSGCPHCAQELASAEADEPVADRPRRGKELPIREI